MKSPEMGGMPLEQPNEESKRAREILNNLYDLSFIRNSGEEIRPEDLTGWRQISDVLSQEDFTGLDQFMSRVDIELDNVEWFDKDLPKKIKEKIEDLISIIQWKRKNQK